jgi:hypothetical protein
MDERQSTTLNQPADGPGEKGDSRLASGGQSPFSPAACVAVDGVIEIRDPAIDVPGIMERIRQGMLLRTELPPLAAAAGKVKMAGRRKELLARLRALQERMRDYGIVQTHKEGWKARLDLFFKRSIRRFIQRHILQQHRIHLKLHTVLQQLILYLQEEDNCLRACLQQAEQEWHAAALELRKEIGGRATCPPKG